MKSTVDEIRARFDADVDRFSNLETGQSATIDAPLSLQLIAEAAWAATPGANSLLDVGCGAGNFSLRFIKEKTVRQIAFVDLSRPMLNRASHRIERASGISPQAMQGDIREVEVDAGSFDVILAGAVLHHLRNDEEWESLFTKLYEALSPGGSMCIFDLVISPTAAIESLFRHRYGKYLSDLKDPDYRDRVFAYIDQEDTPRSLAYQLDLLRQVGFRDVEILHKNGPFAAFGAIKGK